MNEKRFAVLIASSEYQDPKLENLRLPENDVDGLNEILSSEKYGNFAETFVLKNRPSNEVLTKINQVLKSAGKDDLVLIYYSGHGKLNRAGKLHLATPDTEVDLLDTTSIPIETIKNLIDVSSSNKVALILDSCFSGAAGNAFGKTKGQVEDQLQLASGGRGIYLMTSATGIQTALEKEGDQCGVFTKHIIEGIRTGEADRDEDSIITMDELYSYVHDRVLEESHQEPTRYNLNVRGDLVISHSGKSKREERAKEIRKMLLDQADKGYLPDSILSEALRIISLKLDQVTETERQRDGLLDQLWKRRMEMGRFIDEWSKIDDKQKNNKKTQRKETLRKSAHKVHLSTIERVKADINIRLLVMNQMIGFWIYAISFWLNIIGIIKSENMTLFGLLIVICNGLLLGFISTRSNFLSGILLGWGFMVFITFTITMSISISDNYEASIASLFAVFATIVYIYHWKYMGKSIAT